MNYKYKPEHLNIIAPAIVMFLVLGLQFGLIGAIVGTLTGTLLFIGVNKVNTKLKRLLHKDRQQ